MAIETIDNFNIFVGRNIDSRYGPYADETDANNNIDPIFRFEGLTVLLTSSGDQVEYWYYNGVTNNDLKPKGAAISVSGSNGQVVFYSGSTALSGSPNFTFNYTASTPIFNVTGAISASYGSNTVGFYGTASWAQNVLTASYALSGGDVTKIIAGTNITISPPEGTGSVTINSSAAAGSGTSVAATASFTNATIWNFTHNLSSRYVVIQALDNNHQQIIPETIELLNTSSARLTFPTPESGYAMATIGGTTASVALTSLEVLTNNGGKIYGLGNDLVIEPFNNLIISGNMIPGPPYTANTSSYNLGSPTAAWNHLYIANGSVVFVTGSNTAEIQYNGTHITTTKPISGSFTGSLFGTSSWSTNALTASYVNPLRQDVTITGSLLLTQSHISTVDYIDYRVLTAIQQPAHLEGRTHWLDDTKTLQIDTDVNNFSIEVGHQNVVRARNTTGYDLAAGKIVYINGESGNRPTITTASWDGDSTSAATLGFVAQQINDNQTGYVVTSGMLRGINTNAFAPGTQLYLSSSGDYTSTIPVSPKHEVRLGKTITQATDGVIYVDIMNGYELGELHDVLINSSTNGDLVVKSGSLWINSKQLTGSYGLTGSLEATSFTGSLFGTSSWAYSSSQTLTASYIDPTFISSSAAASGFGSGGNNNSPISVTGSTLYSTNPASGLPSNLATNNNIWFGDTAGDGAVSASNSIFLGRKAGQSAVDANRSNFLGESAGADAIYTSGSNFIGYKAGNQAISASNSNFIGFEAGYAAESASYSTLIGYHAGYNPSTPTSIGSNNIIIGTNISLPSQSKDSINLGGIIFATGSHSNPSSLNPLTGSIGGKVGINIYPPQYNLHVSGTVSLPNLAVTSQTNVVTYNSSTGQLFYTSSNTLTTAYNSTSSIIGDGTNVSYNIYHGFNTRNLHITVYENFGNYETVYPDIRRTNANTASIVFANPVSAINQYVVYISQ